MLSEPASSENLATTDFCTYREEAWAHIFPEFYNTAFQSSDYMNHEWGGLFEIIGKIYMGHQDLVVMRKLA